MVQKLVRADDRCISTTLDGEEVILHRESEEYFGLNEVGTRVWESLDEPRTVDEVVALIAEEFDASEAQTREDVESFIDDLKTADLVEATDDPHS